MPSPYLIYALAALTFGLAVAFFRVSDENNALTQAKIAVEMKLKTAEGLYHFLIEEFHQSRGFVLELMVVIILLIELAYLFRGKS